MDSVGTGWQSSDGRGGPIHVLHVDDDAGFTELTAEFLQREDDRFRVVTASSAAAGLDRLAEEAIDCVVSDYQMPGMDGLEFLRRIREDHPDLPFVLFTGKGSESIASDAISAGVSDYLQKSGRSENFSLLANRISNAVERRRAEQEAARARRRYSKLVNNSTDLLAVLDREGRVQYITPAVEDALGYDPAALEGREAFEFVHPDDRAAASRQFESLLANPSTTAEIEVRLRRADGSWATVQNRSRNLLDDPDVGGVVVYSRDVTALKERERDLREARDTIRNVLDSLNDAVFVHDLDGNVVALNRTAVEVLGYSRSELESMTLRDVDASTEWEAIDDRLEQVDARGTLTFETTHVRKDGRQIPVEVSARRTTYRGSPAVIGVARDVSERAELERRLHHYKQAIESSDDLIAAVDADYQYLFANDAYRAYHSLAPDGVVDTSLPETLDDEAFESIRSHLEDALGGESVRYEMTRSHPDRGDRHLEIQYYPLVDGAGNRNGVVATMRDITERKQRQLELSRKSSLLDTIFERVPVHLYVKGTEARHQYVSRSLVSDFGDPDTVIGKTDLDLVDLGMTTEAFARESYRDDRQVLESGEPIFDREEYNPVLDRWFLTSKAPWTDDEGEVIGLIGVTRDITRRKRDQEQLETERDRFLALFENVPNPAVVVEFDDGRPIVRTVNSAFESTFGYRVAEVGGENLDDYVVPDSADDAGEFNERLMAGESLRAEVRRETATGVRDFLLQVVPLERNEQNVEGYAIYTDISKRKERERELARQNQRLDAFASVVSHDLRNPLNVAQGHLELARDSCQDVGSLDRVASAHDRIEALIEELLLLARQGETVDELEAVSLEALVSESWNTVPTATARLVVAGDARIRADPGRLRNLFENLFRNSVEHGGATDPADADVADADGGALTVRVGSSADGFFVEDDGPGIPADERDSVLEWGYTSKSDGTGLGLALVREIAAAHGWDVAVSESDAGGARFEVTGVQRAGEEPS